MCLVSHCCHTPLRSPFSNHRQGLNCELYYRNTDFRKFVSLVPTSAITGEGIPDLLLLITQLTQSMMGDRLSYSHELQCTVLEVKMSDGIGYTIDVILVNGVLRVGDTIVLCGMQVRTSARPRAPTLATSSYVF